MSEEIRDDTRRKVTSVGNSWIVCKSKSHSGHVYYFNTLTGEAAWNLSDAEIEKANHRTKHLECLPGAKPTRCPEPKDKPPSALIKYSKPAQRIFHEPFVVNTVSEQQSTVSTFSNNFNNNANTFNNMNQIAALMQAQINNAPSVDPVCKMNSYNSTISTFNLNTSPTIYNPKVWAIPQTQQIFVAPPIAPVVNHSPAPLNIAYNNLTQTLSQPVSRLVLNSLNNANPSGTITSGLFHPGHYNSGQSGRRNIIKRNIFATKNDLRQKLSAKKRFNTSFGISGVSGVVKSNHRRYDTCAHIASTNEDVDSNDLTDRIMENRSIETQLHEDPTRMDLGPLKCMAPPDFNSDAWFIVVDLDVLLNEFKFLNILTDSDDQCHLMVPKRVMEELKTYVTCTENIQARRILRFLSQQIEIGYAFMVEAPSEIEGESMAEVIHATCIELSENKYHLILLSNDNELLTYKDSSSIKIFSIDEVKNLLTHNPNKQLVPSVPKKSFMIDQLINKIKITVPNDAPQSIDTTSPTIQQDDNFENIPVKDFISSQTNNGDKIGDSTVLKRTVDAGIQTNIEDINASTHLSNDTENRDLNTISNTSQNTKETIKPPVPSVLNVSDKKREIKLKRSTSNQPPVPAIESEKKQFKWRRRRNTTPPVTGNTILYTVTPSCVNQNTIPKEVESPLTHKFNGDICKHTEKTVLNNNPTFVRKENNILEDSIESRESSIYTDQRNTSTKDNVTIEETSTSGIISNSESNIDAESIYSISIVNNRQAIDHEPCMNKPMYEVDSISMEEYLKVKRDEWVSRYIQIMEDVLSQVLQQDPSFSHSAMPPPWTLHEAAQCIAIKFSSNQDIKGAANKLSHLLFCVSDAKGKITMNMTPHQYMQMYSYGVHLLAAIMNVTNNCEDIKIAADSLKKLLDDIRNPNMDSSTNDNFNDNDQNSPHSQISDENNPQNYTTVHTDVPDNLDNNALHEQNPAHNLPEEGHNLRLKKRKLYKEELQKPVKFIRNVNIESSFFESLNLKRINAMKNSPNKMNACDKANAIQLHGNQNSSHSHTSNGKNPQSNNEKETDSGIPTKQLTIIRNFTICPELEDRLKRNNKSKVYEDHDDDLDYDEDYGEYLTEEFCLGDENYNVQHNNANINESDETTDTNLICEPETQNVNEPLLNNDNSEKFKYITCMLLQEVKKALCQVRILCDECYEELKNPEQSTHQKSQLRRMAETAHLYMIQLCRSLESMLDHETNNQNVCNLLKQADINTGHVDDRLLLRYRLSVSKCKDHAEEFRNAIQNIISAFNS